MMKKLLFLTLFMAFFLGFMAPANAAIINADVSDDGYAVPFGGYKWYMTKDVVKAYDEGLTVYGFTKFDLSPFEGLTGDDIVSANFNIYLPYVEGGGMNYPNYPSDMTAQFLIHAYDDSQMLDESLDGQTFSSLPGYVDGTGVIRTHSNGTDVWASLDITDILKGWLDDDYVNNGIEIFEPAATAGDGYGLLWNSNQALDNLPYFEVNAVPIPGAIYLFGSGLIALIGLRRKKV